jgi:alpha-beta hydrolase superfamily lysophospholipase
MINISAELATGTTAGVPFLAVPPATVRPDAPVVLAWHLMDPPRTEEAFAAALPLAGLDAWRIYLGLPMCGARTPAGGPAELVRLGYEDAVLNLQGPIAAQGVAELPAAFAALRDRLGFGDGPVGFVGGSMGSAVAQLAALSPAAPDPAAIVLISPISRLRSAVDGLGRRFGVDYPWGEAALAVAERLDFVSRAAETAARQPAVRIIVGALDDAEGFREPAGELREALAAHYTEPARVDLVTIEGMGHELAEEPGVEPAPQLPQAAEADRLAVAWLRAHL